MSPFDELLAQDQQTDNPFDATVGEIARDEEKSRRQKLLEVQERTREIDPARQAKSIGISREKGVPVDIVYDNLQEFDEDTGPDFDALLKDAPATTELLADPVKGPVAFGDHKPLAAIEGAVRNLGKAEYLQTAPRTEAKTQEGPYIPLVEQVLGRGAGMLTPEQAAVEQRKMIAERAESVQIADERARQARLAVEAERQFREQNDPNFLYGGDNRRQTLTEIEAVREQTASRQSLAKAQELAPTQAPWRNTTDRLIKSVVATPGLAVQGVGALGDALEYLMPTGTADLDEQGRSWLTKVGEEMLQRAEDLAPGDEARAQAFWGSQVPSAVGSMLSFLAAGWVSKSAGLAPGWGAGILGTATGAGEGSRDAMQSGATIGQRHAQTLVSAIFGATEALPVETMFKWVEEAGGRSFTRFVGSLVSNALTEGAQEGVQTFGPDLLARLTYDPKRDVLGNTITAVGAALVTGGFFGAVGSLVNTTSAKDQELLKGIGQAVNESQTSQIAPELVEEHLANLKARGAAPEQVTAPVEAVTALFQELEPDAARSAFPEIVRAIEEAQATGAEVTIPVEKLASLARLKGYEAFTENVRVRPDDMTVAEAKALQGEVDQVLRDFDTKAQPPDLEQSPVFQSVRDQLVKAGQAPEVARTNALLHAAFFATQSERTGVPVVDLMRRYGFEVSSSVATAQEIGPQLDALRRGEEPGAEVQALLAAAGLTRAEVLDLTNEQVVERIAQQTLAQESPRRDSQEAQGVDRGPGGLSPDLQGAENPPADSVGAFAPGQETSQQVAAPADQTQTEEFKRWFGDSKAVTPEGRPQVMYHGTRSDFKEFARIDGGNAYGDGFYFTDDPAKASNYATGENVNRVTLPGDAGPNVMPVYLSAKKPFRVRELIAPADLDTIEKATNKRRPGFFKRGELRKAFDRAYREEGDNVLYQLPSGEDKQAILRDAGFDSLVTPYGWVVFDPTQIKSAVGNVGTFDPNNPDILRQDAKGFITFSPARDRFKVTLTGKADLSTFLHESGHFFLEVLQDSAARGEASAEQVRDLATLRQWMKVEDGKPLTVANHEQFARGFEAYLMEGKAPSYALQQAFTRFKAWLIFVYRRLAGLNVQLTDEVRSVMDRLVASDAAIEEARVQVGWGGKPMPQDYTGLTDGEYKAYVESWMKATDAQAMDADARVMLEAARELKRTWRDEKIRITKEVEAEVAAQPGYQAWKGIEEREMRIQTDSVPADLRGMARGLTTERGLDIDTMAEIFGFESGEEMLKAIAAARLAQRAIPATVRQRMVAIHGEMDAQSLAHEASKAVHNKPTADVLLTEFRALAAKANLKVARNTMALIKAQAEEKVAGLTRRQLDPAKWRRAELKAATEAATFAAKGKAVEAALAKRRQLMAAAMARASLEAQDRIETIRDYLSTFTTDRRRAQLGKAGDMYLDGIDQILEGIEFKEVPLKLLKKRPALQEIVDAAIAADEPIAIPPEILGTGLKNYSQMTLAEMEAVNDAVTNLWTLAKLKNTLKTRQGKIQLDKAMEQAEANAAANLGRVRQTDTLNPGVIDRATNSLRWVRAQLVKMEFLFGWLDGKPEGGLLHSLIYQPIADARAAEYRLMKEMSGLVLDRIRDMPRDQRVRWDTKRQFMGQTLKGANIIAVALNLGNEQNKAKLLKGYGWNEAQLMAELNAFMTKADWDMVQHIWTSIDRLWPHIERVAKNATGLAPPRVVPSAVQTPFGEYAGGYFPIVYDPNQTQRQAENQERNAAANGLFSNNFLRPSLENGFTKKRTNYSAPILLSLDVLSSHLAETIHYVTHYEAVKQADKIRSHPTFQKLVTESMGKEFWREIRPWLQDIANNVTQRRYPELGEVAMRRLRIGTSVAAMGFNIGTGIKQLFGVVTALDAVGPRYWASGIRKAWFSPKVAENWRFAMKESQELEPLIHDFDRDVKQINDAYATKISGGIREGLVRHAFTHIGYMQLVVNVSTWHGAYEQALARGDTHQQAVIHADGVVRKTQSSGSVKDLANAQRSGEATKLLTMFYSYMSIVYNRLEDIAKQQKGLRDIPRTASRLTILAVLPALLNVAYNEGYAALFGDDDDEDDQAFLTKVALESASQITGSVPILRSLIDPRGYGASVSPVVGQVERFNRAAASLRDWFIEGESPSRKELRTISDVVAVTTMLPVASIYKLVDDMVGDGVFER